MAKVRKIESNDSTIKVASRGRNYTNNMKTSLLAAIVILSLTAVNTLGSEEFQRDYLLPEKQSFDVSLEESFEPKGRKR